MIIWAKIWSYKLALAQHVLMTDKTQTDRQAITQSVREIARQKSEKQMVCLLVCYICYRIGLTYTHTGTHTQTPPPPSRPYNLANLISTVALRSERCYSIDTLQYACLCCIIVVVVTLTACNCVAFEAVCGSVVWFSVLCILHCVPAKIYTCTQCSTAHELKLFVFYFFYYFYIMLLLYDIMLFNYTIVLWIMCFVHVWMC